MVVIQPVVGELGSSAAEGADGLALVAVGPGFGFIRTDGKFEINPQFDKAETFEDGLEPVWLGRQRGLYQQARQVRLESERLLN